MSGIEKLTELADTVRDVSGVSGKLSVDDMRTTVGQLGNFRDFGELPNGTDVNDCLKTGIYRVNDQSAYKNVPGSYGVLTVMAPQQGGSYVLQQFVSAIDAGHLFQRVKNGVYSWTKWFTLGGVIKVSLSAFLGRMSPRLGVAA